MGNNIQYDYPTAISDKYLYELGRTLIGNCSYCVELPYVKLNEIALQMHNASRKKNFSNKTVKISEQVALLAFRKLGEYAGMSVEDSRFPYRFRSIEDNMILLRREVKSKCRICDVIHENQHPYLFITFKGDIRLDCRRSTDHGDHTYRTLLIGNIGSHIQPSTQANSETTIDAESDSDDDIDVTLNLEDMSYNNTIQSTDQSNTIVHIEQNDIQIINTKVTSPSPIRKYNPYTIGLRKECIRESSIDNELSKIAASSKDIKK